MVDDQRFRATEAAALARAHTDGGLPFGQVKLDDTPDALGGAALGGGRPSPPRPAQPVLRPKSTRPVFLVRHRGRTYAEQPRRHHAGTVREELDSF